MNNINLQCPMPRCNHVSHNQFELLKHLNSNTSHPTTLHLADRSTCIQHNIFQCCQHNCPTLPTRFFRTLQELHQHNTTHHPPPTPSTITLPHSNIIEPNAPQTPPSPTDIATTLIFSLSRPGAVNNWSSGINFIIELQQQPYVPPDFRNTWRRHLRHRKRNKFNFQLLQAAILRSLSTIYATNTDSNDNTSPLWWLLLHLEMLILAPTTTAQNNNTIQPTISDRITAFQSGNIQELYETAMSCNRLSTNTDPTRRSHIETAQKAADSDQMKIAVNRACTTATVAKINDTNIDIVHKLYPPPVMNPGHLPRPPPSQPFCLPGDICQTIRHTTPHKATGVNADSTDSFIDLVYANIPQVNDDLQYIFNQIYINNIPQPIKHFFSDVYLFCLHKDPTDASKLRPLGIPTAMRRIIARHVAQYFKPKFADYLLPFNFAVGIPHGSATVINAIQLGIEKYISNNNNKDYPPHAQLSSLIYQTCSTTSPASNFSISSQHLSQN